MNPTFPYRPIGDGNDEIRLLRLLPLPEAEAEDDDTLQLKYTLHHLSVSSLTDSYTAWLQHTNYDPKFRAQAWTEYLRRLIDECGLFATDPLRKEAVVRKERKRFVWGEYWALSYVWGDAAGTTKFILVDGVPFAVTENLHLALRRLARERRYAVDGEYLWVDAICINQSDIRERDREVKRMGSVYSLACGVEVWLGEPVGPVEYFIAQWMDMRAQLGPEGFAEWLRLQPELAQAMSQSIMMLTQAAYWERVWVIQELALASLQSVVYYGNVRASLDDVYRMIEYANGTAEWSKENYASSSSGVVNYSVRCMGTLNRSHTLLSRALLPLTITTRGVSAKDEDSESLAFVRSRILDLVAAAKATDPRDKIYGVLALLPGVLSARITPNYSVSKEVAWAMFTRAIIEEKRSLGILASRKSGLASGLPSWVLNLDVNDDEPLAACRAGGDLEGSFDFSADHRTLRCRGVEVDHITTVGASSSIAEEHAASQVRRINFPQILVAAAPSAARAGEPITGAQQVSLLRAFMGDPFATLKDGSPSVLDLPVMDPRAIIERVNPQVFVEEGTWIIRPRGQEGSATNPTVNEMEGDDLRGDRAAMASHALEWLEFATRNWQRIAPFFVWRRANAGFDIFGRNMIDLFPTSAAESCPDHETHLEVLARASSVCMSRRLLTTASGRVGIGAWLMQPGDRIYVVLGCDWPLIMRPAGDDKLEVVGSCFVDGLMLGEAVEGINSAQDVAWMYIV